MDRDRLGLTTHLPGWPLGLFRIAFGLLYLDMALLTLPQFCFAASGAGRVLGVDGWLGPAFDRHAAGGAGWARLLRHAT